MIYSDSCLGEPALLSLNKNHRHTVDGRNPAPVEVGNLSHHVRRVSAPSQVLVWDLFHQQYPLRSKYLWKILTMIYYNPYITA